MSMTMIISAVMLFIAAAMALVCCGTLLTGKLALDMVNDLPVVTVMCGGKMSRFLVDTGANISYVSISKAMGMRYTKLDCSSKVIGCGGEKDVACSGLFAISAGGISKTLEMNIMDIEALDILSDSSGKDICGILGNDFLRLYNTIIDYNDNTIKFK